MSNFKKRKHITEHYKSGEAASAPLDDLPAFRTELKSLIAQYDLNADETGLYWKLEPTKSLSSGPLTGTKKPKDKITVMLACNATGTHKLPAVFIHRYKNPKCIRNDYQYGIIGIMHPGCNDRYFNRGLNALTS